MVHIMVIFLLAKMGDGGTIAIRYLGVAGSLGASGRFGDLSYGTTVSSIADTTRYVGRRRGEREMSDLNI